MNKGFADLCLTTWLRRHTGKNKDEGGKDEAVRPSSARFIPDFVERSYGLHYRSVCRYCGGVSYGPIRNLSLGSVS